MESFNERLKRYTDHNDLEIFGWLTVYLQNSYWGEIHTAKENRLYLCVYLLTHAIIQMISEHMFGFRGKDGTKFYLENFVDGNTQDTKFSLVTDDIHDARNVMAHQGYSSLQYRVEYFADEIAEGWKEDADTILINPKLYAERFESAFRQGSHVEKYRQLTEEVRTTRKYQYIRKWLQLDGKNPISLEVKKLEGCATLNDVKARETVIQKMIYASYKECLEYQEYDAVITDISMPGASGIQILKRIRAQHSTIPVIVIQELAIKIEIFSSRWARSRTLRSHFKCRNSKRPLVERSTDTAE